MWKYEAMSYRTAGFVVIFVKIFSTSYMDRIEDKS